jgi:hypothetical protein
MPSLLRGVGMAESGEEHAYALTVESMPPAIHMSGL